MLLRREVDDIEKVFFFDWRVSALSLVEIPKKSI